MERPWKGSGKAAERQREVTDHAVAAGLIAGPMLLFPLRFPRSIPAIAMGSAAGARRATGEGRGGRGSFVVEDEAACVARIASYRFSPSRHGMRHCKTSRSTVNPLVEHVCSSKQGGGLRWFARACISLRFRCRATNYKLLGPLLVVLQQEGESPCLSLRFRCRAAKD